MYAIFKDKKQVSKSHSTKAACMIEAYEEKLVIQYSADFIGDASGKCIADGYTIQEVE